MSVEVVTKRKGGLTCGGCEADLAATISKSGVCPECGSTDIKKSLVIVRKSVGDQDDNLEDESGDLLVAENDDEELDEDEEDEEDGDEEEDEDLDDDEYDEDEEDDGEDEEDDSPPPNVKKVDASLLGLEALNISTAFAEDVVKVFRENGGHSDYESVMVEFNNVMDAAADRWFAGSTVSKADGKQGHSALIRERVNNICKEGKEMPNRPKSLDGLDIPEDVKNYISELEGGSEVEKRDKYAGLPEEVVKSLENADKIVEERETEKWDKVAKGYSHFPGDKKELAKTLRGLSEKAPSEFEALKQSLDAAEYNLSQSDIFKSYGQPGGGEPSDEITKRQSKAQELVSKGEYETVEQAEVALMDGTSYAATNN